MGFEKKLRKGRIDSATRTLAVGQARTVHTDVHVVKKKRAGSEAHDDALAAYISAIGRIPLLSAEDESKAAMEIQRVEESCWMHLLQSKKCRDFLGSELVIVGELELAEKISALPSTPKKSAAGKQSASPSTSFTEAAFTLRVFDEEKKLLRRTMQNIGTEKTETSSSQFLREAKCLYREAQRRRNDFVTSNLRLVVSVAKKFHHHRLSLNDLIQEGNIGLLKSVQRFDPHKGFRFSTYAHWWIRQAIERSIMNKGCQIRLPVHVYEQRRELAKAKHDLEQSMGRAPDPTELSKALGVPLSRVVDLMQTVPSEPQSLDEPVGDDEGRLLMETILDPQYVAVDEMVSCVDDARSVREALANLSPMERDIINRRFGLSLGDDETLEEIGKSYRLSRERVRQIQVKGLRKIAEFCADPSPVLV